MTDEQYKQLLIKLDRLLDEQEPEKLVIFSRDEEKVLRSMLQRERAWQALGMLAGSMRAVMTWIAVLIGLYTAIKVGFLEWLTKNL